MEAKVSVIPLQVRFRDIDSVGHVNNAVYLTYFEMARVDFIGKFLGGLDPSKSGLVVARTEIDYLKPIYLQSKIEVVTEIIKVGNTSFTFSHTIKDPEIGDCVYASGKVIAVMLDQTGSKMRVPDSIRKLVS